MAAPEEHEKSLSDDLKLSEALQIAASGPTASGTLKIGARRVGWKANQDVDEADAARRFSSLTGREWVIFEKQPQDSDVDVIGRSEDRSRAEDFQVTVLYDEDFWASVNRRGVVDVDLSCDDVVRLIEKAVSKKRDRYPLVQRQPIILLIDLVPGGMLSQFAAHARQVLGGLLREAAFKETWLVGSTADQVFQLWP